MNQQGNKLVVRGGSWVDLPELCRSTIRLRGAPSLRCNGIGFRVVKEVL